MPDTRDGGTSGNPTLAVIRALHGLHDRGGVWPTAQEIASHLELDERDVRAALSELQRARMLRPRQRNGRRVWMAWEAP